MVFTPTFKGSVLAGIGIWTLFWVTLFKLDKLPIIRRFFNKERTLDWINENKVLTLIGTEAVNFGTHGISNPNSAIFALGGTIVNSIFIFLWLPLRQRRMKKLNRETLLRRQSA